MQPHMDYYQKLASLLQNLYNGLGISNARNSHQLSTFLRSLTRMRDMLEKQHRIKQDFAACMVELSDATNIGNYSLKFPFFVYFCSFYGKKNIFCFRESRINPVSVRKNDQLFEQVSRRNNVQSTP